MHPTDLEILRRLRESSNAFVEKSIPFEKFYAVFCMDAHRLFDLRLEELPDNLRAEVLFYLRWEGFGPYEGHVPVRTGWRYGESAEEYGWIDKARFAEQFAHEYKTLRSNHDG